MSEERIRELRRRFARRCAICGAANAPGIGSERACSGCLRWRRAECIEHLDADTLRKIIAYTRKPRKH